MEVGAGDLGEDVTGLGLPDERLGVLVVLVKIVMDRLDEGLDAGEISE